VFKETGKYPGMSFETSQIDSEFIEKELGKTWENFKFCKPKTQMENKNTLIFQSNINCTNLINIGRNLEMDYLCETQITNRLKEGVVLNQLLF
jgi:hypothetical protein